MIFKRVLAWLTVALIVVAVFQWGNKLKNPWGAGSFTSPVIAVLPVAAPGCGEDCK